MKYVSYMQFLYIQIPPRCQGNRGIPERLRREDMPRKSLDIRFSNHPNALVSKFACWPASGEDGCGQSPLHGSRDWSLAGS